jgi:hypothetical protein
MSRPLEATSGRPPGTIAVPLQFHQTTSGTELWAGTADTGHAGWIDGKATDAAGDLLFGNSFRRNMPLRVPARLLCNIVLS